MYSLPNCAGPYGMYLWRQSGVGYLFTPFLTVLDAAHLAMILKLLLKCVIDPLDIPIDELTCST